MTLYRPEPQTCERLTEDIRVLTSPQKGERQSLEIAKSCTLFAGLMFSDPRTSFGGGGRDEERRGGSEGVQLRGGCRRDADRSSAAEEVQLTWGASGRIEEKRPNKYRLVSSDETGSVESSWSEGETVSSCSVSRRGGFATSVPSRKSAVS